MKKLLLVVAMVPFFVTAQENPPANISGGGGVHFETGLSWQQVKKKAKVENKYILVDCFATWCGPCIAMDKTVYPLDSVGDIINKSFVSVRVQCDTTKKDDDAVKGWYSDAHEIVIDYKVMAYPTILFLSPDGMIVHKGLGYLKPYDFVALAKDAMDPGKQYFTLLKDYQEGKKDYSTMPYLAATAMKTNEKDLGYSIAADYARGYLDKLNDVEFCSKKNLGFFGKYRQNIHYGDRVLGWYLNHPGVVDSVMGQKGYSKGIINFVAFKEEVAPRMQKSEISRKTPDWGVITKEIRKKYGEDYIEKNLLTAKVTWYKGVKDWKNYTKYLVAKLEYDSVEKAPKNPINMVFLNNNAYDVFQHSDNKAELETALVWSDVAINMYSNPEGSYYDTKANLLYKLGKKEEALVMEAKAAKLAPKDNEIQDTYKKMLEGKPTW